MNNEIKTSLVAKMPVPRSGVAQGNRVADDKSGENLPPAEETDRSEAKAPPDRQEIERAAEKLSKRAADMGQNLRFDVDDDSGVTVIKVVDPQTDEVVRQIPSEEAVERARLRADSRFNLINETA